MTAISIRPVCLEDAAYLAALHGQSFTPAWDERAMSGFLRQNAKAMIALKADQPVGFALARLAADEAELLSIAVSPQMRGQGLGRTLLLGLFVMLKEAKVQTLFLEVARDNKAACHLYQKIGFVRTGIRPKYYANGTDALTYSLSLG